MNHNEDEQDPEVIVTAKAADLDLTLVRLINDDTGVPYYLLTVLDTSLPYPEAEYKLVKEVTPPQAAAIMALFLELGETHEMHGLKEIASQRFVVKWLNDLAEPVFANVPLNLRPIP
jgi:hypothetical protein